MRRSELLQTSEPTLYDRQLSHREPTTFQGDVKSVSQETEMN